VVHRDGNGYLKLKYPTGFTRYEGGYCRRFDPGGSLDQRVNCRSVSSPDGSARDGTQGGGEQQGETVAFVLSCAQGGCACSRGLQAFARERERERLSASPFSRAATFSYESPGPSFYRRKERAQVYNEGVAMC
jgi:hypothetical protein